jgi:hypothetical protein
LTSRAAPRALVARCIVKVMFPEKFVMLLEHFRCVEPIIPFSMQFYPEPFVALRIRTSQERIEPLIDIYVPDGRRTGDKVNRRDRPIAQRSPWQNRYGERLIGTLRATVWITS